MPLKELSNKTYLRVSYGRICKTCDKDTPKAVSRVTSKGDTIYELIWESITAALDSITFRDDEKFGKSWNLGLVDGEDSYILQINEDSRFGVDFLKKVPNLYHGKVYTFKPYDYEKNGKRKAGIWISEDFTNAKIESYYQEFTQKPDGSWDIKDLHDFPTFEGDSKDKDDLKIYFVKLAKFLRTNAMKHIQGNFQKVAPVKQEAEPPTPKVEEDLPF